MIVNYLFVLFCFRVDVDPDQDLQPSADSFQVLQGVSTTHTCFCAVIKPMSLFTPHNELRIIIFIYKWLWRKTSDLWNQKHHQVYTDFFFLNWLINKNVIFLLVHWCEKIFLHVSVVMESESVSAEITNKYDYSWYLTHILFVFFFKKPAHSAWLSELKGEAFYLDRLFFPWV